MNELTNLLMAVVNTGDDSNAGRWIWVMVIVGVILVVLAIVSVVMSKKRDAQDEDEASEETKKDN